jgi:hypothetical protein
MFVQVKGGVLVNDLITTQQASKILKKDPSYLCRKAREAKKLGYPWPIKRTWGWEAPLKEWEQVLMLTAKRKKSKRIKPNATSIPSEPTYPVTKAVEKLKEQGEIISVKWLSTLGDRSMALGRKWPQKVGRAKVAPLSEWRKMMKDEHLRAWVRKK